MAHKVKIHRVRLKERDDILGCDRLHGIGFRAVCDCGEKSRVVAGYTAARAWAAGHVKVSEHA